MKRPIAELLTMTLKAGAEAERGQYEREAWQILRRKQGYVTHRIYQQRDDPLARLVYSEWESKKTVDGARQYLQGTPLMRRARSVLANAPQRWVVELVGAITSTKGLDLPDSAIAVTAIGRLAADGGRWREAEEPLAKLLSGQPGHITHVLLRGFDQPTLAGSVSHWVDAEAFEKARAQLDGVTAGHFSEPVAYVLYDPVRE
jgi:heme-degrading monooxygenase HmoA